MDGRISPAAAPSGTAEQAACAACAQHCPEGSGVQLRWRAAHGLGFPGTGSSLQALQSSIAHGPPAAPATRAAPGIDALGLSAGRPARRCATRRRQQRSMRSAARRGALLGAAPPGSGDERRPWRPWWGSSVTRGAPSRMISTMAATWPRPASTSAWVRTADGWESRTAPPQPPSTCGEVPLPAVAGRWGDALRSRQVPLWHPGHPRPWAALGLRAVFNLAKGCECRARALFSPGQASRVRGRGRRRLYRLTVSEEGRCSPESAYPWTRYPEGIQTWFCSAWWVLKSRHDPWDA